MDDIDDEDDEMDTKDEDGIVKDDPQFTLAITRGTVINYGYIVMLRDEYSVL